jgi:hypothetical protein
MSFVSRASLGFVGHRTLRSAGLSYYAFIGIRLNKIKRSVELHVTSRSSLTGFSGVLSLAV